MYVSSVSTSKPNFGWSVHLSLWSDGSNWSQSRRLRCCPLPPGVFSTLAFELALPYAGEQAFWATASLATVDLCFLGCICEHPTKTLTNINQFSQLSYTERIIGLELSFKAVLNCVSQPDLCESHVESCASIPKYSWLILISEKLCLPCEHWLCLNHIWLPFLYRTEEKTDSLFNIQDGRSHGGRAVLCRMLKSK